MSPSRALTLPTYTYWLDLGNAGDKSRNIGWTQLQSIVRLVELSRWWRDWWGKRVEVAVKPAREPGEYKYIIRGVSRGSERRCRRFALRPNYSSTSNKILVFTHQTVTPLKTASTIHARCSWNYADILRNRTKFWIIHSHSENYAQDWLFWWVWRYST